MSNACNSEWTMATYIVHNEEMREEDRRFQIERDRRYAEVNVEKEKALKIKETADLAALELARESQKYKEERYDTTSERSLGERGQFVTRSDLATVVENLNKALKPLTEFMTAQKGAEKGTNDSANKLYANVAAITAVIGVIFLVISKVWN